MIILIENLDELFKNVVIRVKGTVVFITWETENGVICLIE